MTQKICIVGAGVSGLCTGALLSKNGYEVDIYEKMNRIGGRTSSTLFKGHILDNGFHIMPFYTKSFIFQVLKECGIENNLVLSRVESIAFYNKTGFHIYPKGIGDLLKLKMIPMKSRIRLLKILLPIAFTSIKKTEQWDSTSLLSLIEKLDEDTKAFFEGVCMLAFADRPEHISLGEFARTIIRANPFKGGTSEFAYPKDGGYDTICKILYEFIVSSGGSVNLNHPVKKIIVKNGQTIGILDKNGEAKTYDCVITSLPAYVALNTLFETGIFPEKFLQKINRLNKTTAVVEVHFALSKKIDSRQVVFPVGQYVSKGIFFISNITTAVSPPGEHLIISGTPVTPQDASNPQRIKEIVAKMKDEISSIYPEFVTSLLWERPMSWKMVESVVKEPKMVWKQKMAHETPYAKGLYFVGDSTISYGIGTDSAAHSSLLSIEMILEYLQNPRKEITMQT